MPKVPNLQIEVQETLRRIIVKMPGTAYETRFGLIPRGLCFLSGFGQDDRRARIISQEFTLMAKAAATEKARELGWLTDENRRRGWTDRDPPRRRVGVPRRVFVNITTPMLLLTSSDCPASQGSEELCQFGREGWADIDSGAEHDP
jgi:hypothetical protein